VIAYFLCMEHYRGVHVGPKVVASRSEGLT
jgi:hypothetical protein